MALTEDRVLVGVVVASQLAPAFMFSGVAVALPNMGADLGAGATALGLIATVFLAGSVAFLLPVGRLADATDKRTIYKLSLLGFAITTGLIGALSWVPGILALRFVQGALAAALSATGPALLADIVPPERRGRAYGASLGAIYVGLTLGPICAGLLIRAADWRAVFFVGAALVLLAYVLVAVKLPSRWRRSARPAHGFSTALILAAVACLVAGSATLGRGMVGSSLLVAGLVLSVAFVAWQRRAEDPLLDVRALVRHRVMRSALLVQLLLYMSAYCTIFVLSIYMQVSLGYPPESSGLILALGSVLMAVTAPIAGFLADRVKAQLIAGLGVVAVLVCTILASTLDQSSSLALLLAILIMQGLGFGLFASPNMTIIMNSATAETVTMASAVSAKARSLGMISGMLMSAVLISVKLGNDPIEHHPVAFVEIVVSAFTTLTYVAGLALLISIVAGLRGRARERE